MSDSQYQEGGGSLPPYKEDFFQRIINVSWVKGWFQCQIDFYVHIHEDPSPPILIYPQVGAYLDIYWSFRMQCPGASKSTVKMFYWDPSAPDPFTGAPTGNYVYTNDDGLYTVGQRQITSHWGSGGGWSPPPDGGNPQHGDSAQFGFTFQASGDILSEANTISCQLIDAGHAKPPPLLNNPELLANIVYWYDPTYTVNVRAWIFTSKKPFKQVSGEAMHATFNIKDGTASI